MILRIGWFSTGRDEAARALLAAVVEEIARGTLDAELCYVFCNREKGESPDSDFFLEFASSLKIPVLTFSSKGYLPSVRELDRNKWRALYHEEVARRIAGYTVDLIVLAGYMLIVSPSFCRTFCLINLHPAAPGGPHGTWQEVIWTLIEKRAPHSGVMIHLVTEELDRGPVISYVTFPIRGVRFDSLWQALEVKLKQKQFPDIVREEGERNELFQEIRRQGAEREIPLLVLTLKAFAEGKVRLSGGKVLGNNGREIEGLCMNEEVDTYLDQRRGTD